MKSIITKTLFTGIFLLAFSGLTFAGQASDDEKIAIEQSALKANYDRNIISDTEEYCPSTYTNTTDDWITNVTFNTIDNDSEQEGPDSYGDYTTISTDVDAGAIYTLSVTFYSEGQWTEYVRAWFDWNQDEIFQPLESFYIGRGVDATVTREILVPLDAIPGQTRFRIIEQYNSDAGPEGACDGQGNHTTTYGETEDYSLNIIPPPAHDVGPAAFVSPIDTGQVATPFTPTVTFGNFGSAMATFDVSLTIVFDVDSVYHETGTITGLLPFTTTDFDFPDYTPENEGDHLLIAETMMAGDENPDNDQLQLGIFVLPQFLPPMYLSAASNQDGVVPLSWFAPRTPPCDLMAYDNGTLSDAYYFMDSENLIANSFEAAAPSQICTVFVHVLTEGDEYWPWPDSHHDPVEIKVWDENDNGRPGEIIAQRTVVANPGEDIVIAFNPPLICETDLFWVSFNNISDTGPYDALGLDAATNYYGRKWIYEGGSWQNYEIYPGDHMIRASVIPSFDNGMLPGDNPGNHDIITDTEELLGYNIYRDIQPGIPIDSTHLIAREIPALLYNDEDVENGSTYYYAVTAVYDDTGGVGESAPAIEVSAIPRAGGQLTSDISEIVQQINAGHETLVDLNLINDGDLDVNFNVVATAYSGALSDGNSTYDDMAPHAKFSSNKITGQKNFETDDQNFPVLSGSGGPDEYGYIWIDSDEPNGPSSGWIDPGGHQVITIGDDENQGPFPIQFDFPFYGQVFTSFRICSNGFISFTSENASHSNSNLPNTDSPENLIAPFWDDLDPESGGTISWYSDQQKTVISWVNMPHYAQTGGPYTFQVVLNPAGEIDFNYSIMFPSVTGATIGIQNSLGTIGIEVVRNAEYIHDDLTTSIKNAWLRATPQFGIVQAGSQFDLSVILDASYLAPGAYQGLLTINSVDINGALPEITIPVTLDVQSSIYDADSELPEKYSLAQNYPNPFNAATTIRFGLPELSDVEINIYNVLGQKVITLFESEMPAGYLSLTWDASSFSSGIYFYKLTAGDYTEIRSMTLIK